MRRLGHLMFFLAVSCSNGGLDPSSAVSQGLVVHEWGTYTSVQGSNGVTLDGMQHEEEALPAFVHQRSLVGVHNGKGFESLPSAVNQKLETPVLYFYSAAAMDVQATVEFPGGIISQWFPAAAVSEPAIGSMTEVAHGKMSWSARLDPGQQPSPLFDVPADSVWAPSRRVAATPVVVAQETDKFIFYRGLGKFEVPFRVEARADGLVDLINDSDEPIEDAFFLRVHDTGGAIVPLGKIDAHGALRGLTPPFEGKEHELDAYADEAMTTVAAALERSGLYHDEARAMVETWSRSYFRGLGLRVLYVTPRAWTDRLLPLSLSPQPSALVRTLVGRVEVLTRADETALLTSVSTDITDQALLTSLGRFAEPKLRRVRQLVTDPALATRVDGLIALATTSP